VNRTLLAGIIAAAVAVATPVFAQPAENANPAPAQAAAANERAQGDREPGGGWARGEGRGGMQGWPMMRHGMWRRAMMRWDPKQRCIDRLAWRAARRAYVEAELDLTAEQRPLWDKVQSIAQAEQQKERQLCQSLKPAEESTVLDRLDRAQQFLSARLDALQSAKPALQSLYQALTPDQRAIMDHPFHRD
jgi:LTXXQ motif family protein